MSRGVSLAATGIKRTFRTGFGVQIDQLDVAAGKTLAILGPSGSGKSTLLSILGLLEKPDTGEVLVDGVAVSVTDRAARMLMAAVFQRPYLIRGTVEANVAYGLTLRGVPKQERASRVREALCRVGLEDFGGRSAGTLSGGEAQRVALARALVLEPQILLLDEPLASLDPLLKRRLVADFAGILKDSGVTVVYVTHDHDEARVIADDIAVMNEGRIVAHGPAADVMALAADEWTAEFLGMEIPGRGSVVAENDGVVEIQTGSGSRIAAAGSYAPGTEVVFSVPPEDVILAVGESDFGPLSARNTLDGLIDRIEPHGATWRVVVAVDGLTLASHVSHAARRELGLEPGGRVTVIFKATAVRVAPVRKPLDAP